MPRVDEDVVDLPAAAQRRDPDCQPAPGVAGAAEVGVDVDVVADAPAAPDELALVAVELLGLDPLRAPAVGVGDLDPQEGVSGRADRLAYEAKKWSGEGRTVLARALGRRRLPDGLAGEEIPIESRIVAACDAFNAMTTDRSYRSAMSVPAAVRELSANAGAQFDPQVVEALVRAVGPVPAEATGKAA